MGAIERGLLEWRNDGGLPLRLTDAGRKRLDTLRESARAKARERHQRRHRDA